MYLPIQELLVIAKTQAQLYKFRGSQVLKELQVPHPRLCHYMHVIFSHRKHQIVCQVTCSVRRLRTLL